MRTLILALLLLIASAAPSHAGWFAEITFAPSPYIGRSYSRPSYNRTPHNWSRYHRPTSRSHSWSYGR